jgi:hypothetical protein
VAFASASFGYQYIGRKHFNPLGQAVFAIVATFFALQFVPILIIGTACVVRQECL